MNTRRRNVSDDDLLTIIQRDTRLKKTSEPIPVDLVIEIFLRLPTNSLARCRFVSKLWASIFRSPDFTELFMARSCIRPQLLFAIEKQGKLLFFSSPQPQNPDLNSSPVVVSGNELTYFPFGGECEITGPVHGWICVMNKRKMGKVFPVPVICNPSTGQSLTLPKVELRRAKVKSYFGFDPTENQFKVLVMSSTSYAGNGVFDEYHILTIGTGENLSWRTIECCIPPHYSSDNGIFINGVLYYRAAEDSFSKLSTIVCFDFTSEKFKFITIEEESLRLVSKGNLINYNGKLGSVVCDRCGYVDGRNGRCGSIELWVLEDAEKIEWSNFTIVLPTSWQNILGINCLRFVGVTRTNEIVFSSMKDVPFCVFYYNIERRTITKVGIQGMEAIEGIYPVYKFLDHVEDVNLM